MNAHDFTDDQLLAVAVMLTQFAKRTGEDMAGAILKSGAFHMLPDSDKHVVLLARKIEQLRVRAEAKASALHPDLAAVLEIST